MSTPILVTINGETRNLTAWAKVAGLSPSVVSTRYKRGDRGKRLIEPKRNNRGPKPHCELKAHTINGVTKTIDEWAEQIGVCRTTFEDRIKAEWSDNDLLKPPQKAGRRQVNKPYRSAYQADVNCSRIANMFQPTQRS